jgi:hypothetical protein
MLTNWCKTVCGPASGMFKIPEIAKLTGTTDLLALASLHLCVRNDTANITLYATFLMLCYTVSYRQTGGEPYALKGARTVRWGVHLLPRD